MRDRSFMKTDNVVANLKIKRPIRKKLIRKIIETKIKKPNRTEPKPNSRNQTETKYVWFEFGLCQYKIESNQTESLYI